ncbi:hypothetical protein SAY86_024867 [Trapa natans]|uniref:Uncharacterized protein n=1 Tax=Trapa natans TaxID=22666 RepID=A0AAN7RDQ7_TRANT|nr:hypothetical protein SAY86_024867 [Trapa natans]
MIDHGPVKWHWHVAWPLATIHKGVARGWIRSTPNSKGNCSPAITKSSSNNDHAVETTAASLNCHHLKTTVKQGSCNRQQHQQQEEEASPSLSLLEKWLLDESTIGTNGLEEEEEVMEIPSIFS